MRSMDLSGTWQFYMGAAEDAVFSGDTVRLPGTMDENRRGLDNSANVTVRHLHRDFVYTGPAVYQREVTVPAEWMGRPVHLYLERTKKHGCGWMSSWRGLSAEAIPPPTAMTSAPCAARGTPTPSQWR